jgi:glucose-6-phosphate isomerase
LAAGVTSGDYLSGFLQGTRSALYEKDRESISITVPDAGAKTIGALIALYERAVGLYASLVNINAYHQPGVEAGKKAAAAILSLQTEVVGVVKAAKEPLLLAEIADHLGKGQDVEAIYKILRHLAANDRGIILHGDRRNLSELRVSGG